MDLDLDLLELSNRHLTKACYSHRDWAWCRVHLLLSDAYAACALKNL